MVNGTLKARDGLSASDVVGLYNSFPNPDRICPDRNSSLFAVMMPLTTFGHFRSFHRSSSARLQNSVKYGFSAIWRRWPIKCECRDTAHRRLERDEWNGIEGST
jgi:hypothetical protein